MSATLKHSTVITRIGDYTKSLRHQHDAAVLVIHCYLLERGFSFLGFGESSGSSPDPAPGSPIPDGWNTDADVYSFRYSFTSGTEKGTLLLKLLIMGPTLLVHGVILEHPDRVFSTEIRVADFVNVPGPNSTAEAIFKDVNGLTSVFWKDVGLKLVSSLKGDSLLIENNRAPMHSGFSNASVDRGFAGQDFGARPTPYDTGPHAVPSPFGLGEFDVGGPWGVDFGSEYGGNLMGPQHPGFFSQNRQPRGMPYHPPGARYDPFGPPQIFPGGPQYPPQMRRPTRPPFSEPDPNHLPPPGYDDMFM